MKVISYIVLAVAWLGAVYIAVHSAPQERRIDCGLAEFHPDYTTEMRQACREARRVKT